VTSRVCLDTSAYSQFRRGHPPAVEAITRARRLLVPTIVLGELRTGFALGRRGADNEARLRRFLAEPVVEVLDVDEDAAIVYAEIMVDLRRAGTPVPTNDAWIAALAAREGATVLTYDEHFAHVRRVSSHVLRS
jgi:predicted nucleic acid-binding protein